MVNVYRKTSANIRKEINDFYARFARENKLEYSDAVRYLNRSEALEWKASVEDYIKEIAREKNPAVRERLMREYDARAYGARITRLESLNASIDNELSKLYARANEQFRELLGENYTDGYYRAIYDIQSRFGYSSMFATVNPKIVENALSYPWSGANFSDRLWKHKFELQNQLRETLTTGFIRGDSVQTMAKRLAERLDVSRSQALRLVITESSHIHNTAELDAYKECGFEEYEFMASLSERTCEVCGGMDGKRFKLTDKQLGVNFPPLHPNCRCTTIAFDPDDDIEGFKERLEHGELNYDKWYEKYVKGRKQQSIESKQSEDFTAKAPNPQPIVPDYGEIDAEKELTNEKNSDIIKKNTSIDNVTGQNASIPDEKFYQYALNPTKSPDKAKAFKSALGYDLDNARDLIANIREHFDKTLLKPKGDNGYGQRYEMIMELTGPNGKSAKVLTAWIDDKEKREFRLVTVHIDD